MLKQENCCWVWGYLRLRRIRWVTVVQWDSVTEQKKKEEGKKGKRKKGKEACNSMPAASSSPVESGVVRDSEEASDAGTLQNRIWGWRKDRQLRALLLFHRMGVGLPAPTSGGSEVPVSPAPRNLLPLTSVSTVHTFTFYPTTHS